VRHHRKDQLWLYLTCVAHWPCPSLTVGSWETFPQISSSVHRDAHAQPEIIMNNISEALERTLPGDPSNWVGSTHPHCLAIWGPLSLGQIILSTLWTVEWKFYILGYPRIHLILLNSSDYVLETWNQSNPCWVKFLYYFLLVTGWIATSNNLCLQFLRAGTQKESRVGRKHNYSLLCHYQGLMFWDLKCAMHCVPDILITLCHRIVTINLGVGIDNLLYGQRYWG
jgi:hypothetical protein